MDILRIATAGSVDDGKSTLIGRLLYETNSITKDKIEAIEIASQRRGLDFVDLSLLTDGLIAEREQGITIDVAHIYFNTNKRKYIIADTPGHFEYTRNMVTGASNAQVSIILIDARNGVVEQTKRHFFISTMLKIPNILVAINKMDLVDYNQDQFEKIKADFTKFANKITFDGQNIQFIPISSLYGENISTKSTKIDWFNGNGLLEILENLAINLTSNADAARFPVQHVVRPKTDDLHDYRGYAGRVASGVFNVGDQIVALPSNQTSTIKTIEKFGQNIASASSKESVVITLADDIDISRGNMIAPANNIPTSLKGFSAQICWLDASPVQLGKMYLIQHGINRVKAKVTNLDSKMDINTFETLENIEDIKLNEIGTIGFKTASPIFADDFKSNTRNGVFIIIDDQTNNTVGVGLIK